MQKQVNNSLEQKLFMGEGKTFKETSSLTIQGSSSTVTLSPELGLRLLHSYTPLTHGHTRFPHLLDIRFPIVVSDIQILQII